MLRRIYDTIALASLLTIVLLCGLAGYLAAKGNLTGQRLRAAFEALTSQPAEGAASQPASRPTAGPASEVLAAGRESEQVMLQRFELLKRQLENEKALLEAARIAFIREKEAFERAKKQWQQKQEQRLKELAKSGFQKELEYLSSISPKQALALLRQKQEAEAAQLLMAMETRKGKKIIESCKTDEERKWIGRILELIRQQDSVQAAALAGG